MKFINVGYTFILLDDRIGNERRGKEELDKKKGEMKEIGKMAQENVLVFLCVYRENYSEDKFQELMDRLKS